MNFVMKFSHLPTVAQFLKATAARPILYVGIFPGHDHILAAFSLEEPEHALAVKSGIHSKPNAASGHVRRHLSQTYLEEWDGSSGCSCVSRPQAPMPKFVEMGLETEERMVGTSAVLLGIVTYTRSFLFPVDGDDDRVHIEYQCGTFSGQPKQMSPQTVVEPNHLANGLGRKTFEKPPQGRLVWKASKPEHFLKRPVVLKSFCLVDPFDTHDDGEQKSEGQLGWMVTPTPDGILDISLNQPSKLQFVAKTMNQPHPAIVCEMGFSE
jgi:hypothetical protein